MEITENCKNGENAPPKARTFASCLACGHLVTRPWLDKCRDLYLHTPFIVTYGECPNCGLIQQVPAPVDTFRFYPESYPMHSSGGKLMALGRRLLIRKVYYIPPPVRSRDYTLLDFGAGDGSYLQFARHHVARVIGFEFSSQQAERLTASLDCPVYSNLDKAEEDLAGRVDIVTAHFVLEHLSDLHAAFRFWGRILKPGGTLHVAVPNIRSWEARFFRQKWHGLDPPRHISFPGGESLALLMEKHGFTLVRKGYAIFPNTVAASISNSLVGQYHHALFLLLIPLGFIMACLMPQGTMVYEMRKTP